MEEGNAVELMSAWELSIVRGALPHGCVVAEMAGDSFVVRGSAALDSRAREGVEDAEMCVVDGMPRLTFPVSAFDRFAQSMNSIGRMVAVAEPRKGEELAFAIRRGLCKWEVTRVV